MRNVRGVHFGTDSTQIPSSLNSQLRQPASESVSPQHMYVHISGSKSHAEPESTGGNNI